MKLRTSFKTGLILGLVAGIFLLYWPERTVYADASAAKAHIDSITNDVKIGKQQIGTLKTRLDMAENASHQLAVENDKLTVRNAQLEKAFFTPTQKRWMLWLGLAIVILRGIGLVNDGMLGSLASGLAHGLMGVATFGISLVLTLGDNLWFRKIAPKKQAAASAAAESAELNAPPADGSRAHIAEPDQSPNQPLETM